MSATDLPSEAVFDTVDHLVGDSGVVSRLTVRSPDSSAYNAMLSSRRLAISFQSAPELRNMPLGEKRRKALDALLAVTLKLPHSDATGDKYAAVAGVRQALRKKKLGGQGAGDADMWILSSAIEHGLPLMTHDSELVQLGRAMNHPTLTNLPDLREDNPVLPPTRSGTAG